MIIRIQMKTKNFLKILRCVSLVETGRIVIRNKLKILVIKHKNKIPLRKVIKSNLIITNNMGLDIFVR